MTRQGLLLFFILTALVAPAQKKPGLEKKLDTFWKSKNLSAQSIAREVSFRPGDTIADIGTADGWFAAALSMYADSLTFYLEDIDSAVWNRAPFDSALVHFSKSAQKKVSHQFHYVKGTENATGLPSNAFNKVLIIDTYHHFKHRQEMLSDAVSLLKPGGQIVILEALARRPGDFHQGCRTPIYLEHEIISHLQSQGLHLKTIKLIHKVAGRKNKLFIFVKK
ncbi:MAG: class I SAM-dependent methyltransferase [Cyclobacteriaceae bacterium]